MFSNLLTSREFNLQRCQTGAPHSRVAGAVAKFARGAAQPRRCVLGPCPPLAQHTSSGNVTSSSVVFRGVCWPDLSYVARRAARECAGRRGSGAAWRASYGSYSRANGLDEAGRLQQLQGQVFELKQRLVESEARRQAAEKAVTESHQDRQQLQRRLAQTRWALAAVVVALLLATGVLAWAELEAPPLGTMTLRAGADARFAFIAEAVAAAARRVGAWLHSLASFLQQKGVTF